MSRPPDRANLTDPSVISKDFPFAVEYDGLTHLCHKTDCCVPGFVRTLEQHLHQKSLQEQIATQWCVYTRHGCRIPRLCGPGTEFAMRLMPFLDGSAKAV